MSLYNYFTDNMEHPNVSSGEILPFGVVYSEVGTDFLDAFINSCENHLSCYTLDYYRNNDVEKEKYVKNINTKGYDGVHTNLHKIEDDVLILSKIEEGYMLFWYHMSGRCDIGRFKTKDTIDKIETNVIKWLREMKIGNIIGYSKLNVKKYLKRYVNF